MKSSPKCNKQRTCFWNDCWIYLWHFSSILLTQPPALHHTRLPSPGLRLDRIECTMFYMLIVKQERQTEARKTGEKNKRVKKNCTRQVKYINTNWENVLLHTIPSSSFSQPNARTRRRYERSCKSCVRWTSLHNDKTQNKYENIE